MARRTRPGAWSRTHPDRYFYPDQYNNAANWRAHYEDTGVEIWAQTDGRVTHFIAGLGTSGTFVGTARRLKAYNARVRCISMQPDMPLHGLEGMKHMATASCPDLRSVGGRRGGRRRQLEAQEMARRLAREEGLFVGVSAGANVFAAVRLARTLPPGSVVVTVLCDTGSRYLSDEFWTGDARDRLSHAHRAAIARHARSRPYRGVLRADAGALCDDGEGGTRAAADLNAREAEARHNRFLIGPLEMLRGERHARSLGLDIVGIYHSHPDVAAVPSQFDLDHAWPIYSYVIVTVTACRRADAVVDCAPTGPGSTKSASTASPTAAGPGLITPRSPRSTGARWHQPLLEVGHVERRHAFVEQQLGGEHLRLGVEVPLQHVVAQHVAHREQAHALVMRHPGAHRHRRAVAEVHRLVQPVGAGPAPASCMRRRLRRLPCGSTSSARNDEYGEITSLRPLRGLSATSGTPKAA